MVEKRLLDEEDQILIEDREASRKKENLFTINLNMPIKELTLSHTVTVNHKVTVEEVLKIFKEGDVCSALIANDENVLVGLFTETDLMKKIILKDIDITKACIKDYMAADPEILNINDPLSYALNKFANGAIKNIPIKSENDEIKHMLSISDIVDFIATGAMQVVLNLPPDPHKVSVEINGG